ncbi:c-type cytochrome biogenesis protein CcmI/CycH [Povalibacter sp.]|uniref:tetratricopeptide repeat protein n=1 Tax=Povalibacter sp. TaxID=1962978 RepID=UPI002F4284ED
MTAFAIVCAAMLLVTLVWTTLPLWRVRPSVDAVATRSERRVSSVVVVLAVTGLAAGLYAYLSNWDWSPDETAVAQNAQVDSMLAQLESKLTANPQDLQGWLLLGRSYTSLQQFARAAQAYQRAYDLSKGEDIEAIVGLGEALALLDQSALGGRAGDLFNEALRRAPDHPKALWYGSIAALQAGDLKLGRDRMQAMLAHEPPPQLRTILEQQIQDLNQQLGDAGEGGSTIAAGPAVAAKHSIQVAVSIAPAIQQQLKGPTPLFVLARDPTAPGPPLAVQRRTSADAPLTIELSEADAMMPTRTLASASRVQVVARLSLSGAPQERSGDFYGEADYEFGKDTGTLRIVIDRTVP